MSRYRRDPRRTIVFTDRDGNFAGKAVVVESGSRGNKHFNPRRPNGPTCGMPIAARNGDVTLCSEPWQPICDNHDCPGHRIPKSMIKLEKFGPRRYAPRSGREEKRRG